MCVCSKGVRVVFSGEYFKALDEKGRVSIPKEFRDLLQQQDLVVTKNLDGGLTLYPPEQWRLFVRKLEQCSPGKQRTALNRLYIAPKTDVRLDRQGRIPLTRAQRKWAGIDEEDRDVVVVGNFQLIDIFSNEHYRNVVDSAVQLLKGDEDLVSALDLP